MVLWHMHQPYYVDMATGKALLPWVRLHALKDYYGMVALLREFPQIHQTFNLVPSMVEQLIDYCEGRLVDEYLLFSRMDAATLTPDERQWVVDNFFAANIPNMVEVYPRFAELHQKAKARSHFSEQDLRDLQAWYRLCWFDYDERQNNPELRALITKGRGYTEADKLIIDKLELLLLQRVLPEYRAAAERGQIEISVTPYYHPILPLLIDSAYGEKASPGLKLPRTPFRHPEDAEHQLASAVEFHRQVFGQTPRGMWPSEGSVCPEVCTIAARNELQWIATDEEVLAMSQSERFFKRDGLGTIEEPERLYLPYEFGDVKIFFRDHELSDLIGFVYSKNYFEAAATDFISHLSRIAQTAWNKGIEPVVSVILDGENAWETYRDEGRPFLRTLYGMLEAAPWIDCLTASEICARLEIKPAKLETLHPGSWISHNFNIWIGHPEDNLGWDYLSEARQRLIEWEKTADLSDEKIAQTRAAAWKEIYVAEGSDWFWWYGDDHSSAHDREFDDLFRRHLKTVYQLIGEEPPLALDNPIKGIAGTPPAFEQWEPTGPVEATIDGKITSYFEWLGAGGYQPPSGSSMHASRLLIKKILFGHDHQGYLNLMIEWHQNWMPSTDVQMEVLVHVSNGETVVVPVTAGHQTGNGFEAATDRVTEIHLLTTTKEFNIAIRLAGKIVMRVPELGTLSTSETVW